MLRIKELLDFYQENIGLRNAQSKYDKGTNTLPKNNNNTSQHREIDWGFPLRAYKIRGFKPKKNKNKSFVPAAEYSQSIHSLQATIQEVLLLIMIALKILPPPPLQFSFVDNVLSGTIGFLLGCSLPMKSHSSYKNHWWRLYRRTSSHDQSAHWLAI